jgi:hypothetical protein
MEAGREAWQQLLEPSFPGAPHPTLLVQLARAFPHNVSGEVSCEVGHMWSPTP